MVMVSRAQAMAEGRKAALAALVEDRPMPENPYRKGTKARGRWQHAADRTGHLFAQIMEIGHG